MFARMKFTMNNNWVVKNTAGIPLFYGWSVSIHPDSQPTAVTVPIKSLYTLWLLFFLTGKCRFSVLPNLWGAILHVIVKALLDLGRWAKKFLQFFLCSCFQLFLFWSKFNTHYTNCRSFWRSMATSIRITTFIIQLRCNLLSGRGFSSKA